MPAWASTPRASQTRMASTSRAPRRVWESTSQSPIPTWASAAGYAARQGPSFFAAASAAPEVTIGVADFYDVCVPLVQATVEAMAPVMALLEADQNDMLAEIVGIYVVGGASALPVVGRVLRELFGRRVHRSPYPSAAIAMGLAIAADEEAGFELSDRLSRHFGVFREGASGREVIFDPIFDKGVRVPGAHEAQPMLCRTYPAAHNVGRYRFGNLAHQRIPQARVAAHVQVVVRKLML